MSGALLQVQDLRVERGGAPVLEGVSFELQPGEMLGIAGVSGAGKSTLARAVLRLIAPSGGAILWRGEDLLALPERRLRRVRREMQIVFQDPAGSLDPRWTVSAIVREPLAVHRLPRGPDAVLRLLRMVELGPELLERHPHQLSGGQAQRVALARALATSPSLLVADEVFSALDVSLRAQMANLLGSLRRSLGIACLFISHDLRLVAHICDRIGVLSGGTLVDLASPGALFREPRHPATRALLAASRLAVR
jgi:ABC-type glutathione transport system ATPase component